MTLVEKIKAELRRENNVIALTLKKVECPHCGKTFPIKGNVVESGSA